MVRHNFLVHSKIVHTLRSNTINEKSNRICSTINARTHKICIYENLSKWRQTKYTTIEKHLFLQQTKINAICKYLRLRNASKPFLWTLARAREHIESFGLFFAEFIMLLLLWAIYHGIVLLLFIIISLLVHVWMLFCVVVFAFFPCTLFFNRITRLAYSSGLHMRNADGHVLHTSTSTLKANKKELLFPGAALKLDTAPGSSHLTSRWKKLILWHVFFRSTSIFFEIFFRRNWLN